MWLDPNENAKSLKILENRTQKYVLILFVTIGHTHARKQNHWIRQENSQWNDAYIKCTQVRLVVIHKISFLRISVCILFEYDKVL